MDESLSPTAIADRRFRYFHGTQKGSPEAIDVHHIIVKRSKFKKSILRLIALLLLASSICFLCSQGKLFYALWSLLLAAFIFRLLLQKLVEKAQTGFRVIVKNRVANVFSFGDRNSLYSQPDFYLVTTESVIILPGFGVQLETQYGSGRTSRRFLHVGNILKPVLNECVTPITCYWSLALLIRGEEELMLVFKELRPPIKMLVPIWKALNIAIEVAD